MHQIIKIWFSNSYMWKCENYSSYTNGSKMNQKLWKHYQQFRYNLDTIRSFFTHLLFSLYLKIISIFHYNYYNNSINSILLFMPYSTISLLFFFFFNNLFLILFPYLSQCFKRLWEYLTINVANNLVLKDYIETWQAERNNQICFTWKCVIQDNLFKNTKFAKQETDDYAVTHMALWTMEHMWI